MLLAASLGRIGSGAAGIHLQPCRLSWPRKELPPVRKAALRVSCQPGGRFSRQPADNPGRSSRQNADTPCGPGNGSGTGPRLGDRTDGAGPGACISMNPLGRTWTRRLPLGVLGEKARAAAFEKLDELVESEPRTRQRARGPPHAGSWQYRPARARAASVAGSWNLANSKDCRGTRDGRNQQRQRADRLPMQTTLVKFINDSDARVSSRAVAQIAAAGLSARGVVPELIRFLWGEDPDERRADAAFALSFMANYSDLPHLRKLPESKNLAQGKKELGGYDRLHAEFRLGELVRPAGIRRRKVAVQAAGSDGLFGSHSALSNRAFRCRGRIDDFTAPRLQSRTMIGNREGTSVRSRRRGRRSKCRRVCWWRATRKCGRP